MFGESKTLIVVSKDEMAINQLKKIVESDKEKSPSVKVVAWTEKVWNANKKSGNIESNTCRYFCCNYGVKVYERRTVLIKDTPIRK